MWRAVLLCVASLVAVVLGNTPTYIGPIFTVQPEDTMFDTSSNLEHVVLQCRATGTDPITYRWLFDDVELDSATNSRLELAGGRLTINAPDKDVDRGEYVCEASNRVGTIRSHPAQLTFAYVNSFDPTATTSTQLTVGEGACLSCNPPDHYPEAITVGWTRGTTGIGFISPSPRVRIMEDGRLCFAYVLATDDNVYNCHVTAKTGTEHSTGSKGSPTVTVTVRTTSNPDTGVKIDSANSPKNQEVVAGDDVEFECFAFGRTDTSGAPVITWDRSQPPGASMPTGNYVKDQGQVLVLRNVQTEHSGTYRCNAGTVQASATLQVIEAPRWVTEPQGAQRDINTNFDWTVEASGDNIAYMWYRNGQELDTTQSRHTFTNSFRTLTITDLVVEDTAMYQCFASNTYGTLYSAAQLTVRAFAPEFQSFMDDDQPAPLGSTITIMCPVDGAPYPTITWTRGDEAITENEHYNLTANPPNLVINNVLNSDAGEYTCSAENSFGGDSETGSIVIKEATMITIPPENAMVEVGESHILRCEASHDPSLELAYIWEHNDVQIDLGERERFRMPHRNKGDLELMDLTMQDGGSYTCVALTVADSAKKTAELTIAGPPGPPSGLTVRITDRNADLSWSPGSSNNNDITSFVVEGKTEYRDEWMELRSATGSGMNSVRITGLNAYSLYTFRVYAVNGIGSGSPSDPVQASEMTAKDRPEAYPQNVGGGGGNAGDLRVTWDEFPPSQWNSDTVSYTVEWRRLGSDVSAQGSRDQSDAVVFVATEGIDLYTEYQVRVQAANDINSGPWSPWATIYSYQEAPKTAPTAVSATGTSAATVEVTWTGIDSSTFQGVLEGYKLKYWSQGSDKSNAQTAMSSGTGTRTSIPGMEASTQYTVVVLAYSGGGDGPESSEVSAFTLKQAPQRIPGNVRALVKGTDITVTWSAITTSSSEEALQGYKVHYRETGVFKEDAAVIVVKKTDTRAVIRGLETDTQYLVSVQGYSNGGPGAMSDPPISVTTATARTGQSSDDPNGRASRTTADLSLALLLFAAFIHTVITHL